MENRKLVWRYCPTAGRSRQKRPDNRVGYERVHKRLWVFLVGVLLQGHTASEHVRKDCHPDVGENDISLPPILKKLLQKVAKKWCDASRRLTPKRRVVINKPTAEHAHDTQ